MGQLLHVSAHELRRSVDGLDAGTPARIQTLPEVSLQRVIQNKSGPSLRVIMVRPDHGALAPRCVSPLLPPLEPQVGQGPSRGAFERRHTRCHNGLALLGLLGQARPPRSALPEGGMALRARIVPSDS